jgi:hypothetical protein
LIEAGDVVRVFEMGGDAVLPRPPRIAAQGGRQERDQVSALAALGEGIPDLAGVGHWRDSGPRHVGGGSIGTAADVGSLSGRKLY